MNWDKAKPQIENLIGLLERFYSSTKRAEKTPKASKAWLEKNKALVQELVKTSRKLVGSSPFTKWVQINWPKDIRQDWAERVSNLYSGVSKLILDSPGWIHRSKRLDAVGQAQLLQSRLSGARALVSSVTKWLSKTFLTYGPGPKKLTFAGLRVTNPDQLSDWVVQKLLNGVVYLRQTFNRRGLEPLLLEGLSEIVLAPEDSHKALDGIEAYGRYNSNAKRITMMAKAVENKSHARFIENWVHEIFMHEFGHFVHMSFISREAKEFWDSTWNPVQEAEERLENATKITPKERKGFYKLIKASKWKPNAAARKLNADARLKFIAWLKIAGFINPSVTKQVRLNKAGKEAFSILANPEAFVEADLLQAPGRAGFSRAELEDMKLDGFFQTQVENNLDAIKTRLWVAGRKMQKTIDLKARDGFEEVVQELQEGLKDLREKAVADVTETWGSPSWYAKTNVREDFAESFVQYVTMPEQMTENALFRMKRTLWLSGFGGKTVQKRLAVKIARRWMHLQVKEK